MKNPVVAFLILPSMYVSCFKKKSKKLYIYSRTLITPHRNIEFSWKWYEQTNLHLLTISVEVR